MRAPLTRCSVPETAMARTRDAVSARSFSGSFASESLIRLNGPASPLTITALGGPISRTSVFSAAITSSLNQHRDGLFNAASKCREELGPERAIDHSMIAGERDRH